MSIDLDVAGGGGTPNSRRSPTTGTGQRFDSNTSSNGHDITIDSSTGTNKGYQSLANNGNNTHPNGSPPSPYYNDDVYAHQQLLDKITRRLLPFIMVCYTFSFLDRSNLSNVHTALLDDIGITEEQYGSAASIFFVPYVLLEVPSNLILEKVDARRWISRIIFTWGLISTLMLFVNGYSWLMFARFMLGVAEAGFFPGIVFYLTLWFTPSERAHRLFWVFVAQPISGLLGGLISYPVLNYMDGIWGLSGWRWLFLIEGFPTVILGVVAWFYLPASPVTATWLTDSERRFLVARMRTSNPHAASDEPVTSDGDHTNLLSDSSSSDHDNLSMSTGMRGRCMAFKIGFMRIWNSTYRNPFIWLAVFINFTTLFPVVAVSFYLPAIISSFGLSSLQGNLLSAIPYGFASIVMFFNSTHSDRTNERFKHVIGMNVLGFVALGLVALALEKTHNIYFQVAMLSIAAAGIWAAKPPLLAWLSSTLPGNVAVSVATITCAGNISGIIAPILMSGAKTWTGNYVLGCLILMGLLVVASVLVFGYYRLIIAAVKRRSSQL